MRAVIVVVIGLVAACGENPKLVAAQHSAYNADRSVVIAAIVEYLHDHFPTRPDEHVTVDDAAGTISTDWWLDGPGTRSSPSPRDSPRIIKHGYLRADIAITGGPPWRLSVTVHGGEMLEDARLMSDVESERDWVVIATNRLNIDLYKRLQPYAVPVDETSPRP